MNSASSPGTFGKRPSFQSSLACSIRSFELETKFHQMCRSPSSGAPPKSAMRASVIECRRCHTLQTHPLYGVSRCSGRVMRTSFPQHPVIASR
jgi:hypothetical protein